MSSRFNIIIAAAALLSGYAGAAELPDTLVVGRTVTASAAATLAADRAMAGAPGANFYARDFSLTSVNANITFEDRSEAYAVQDGTGLTMDRLGAEAYIVLDPAHKVWGSAYFTTGSTRGICWNNSAGWRKLSPYVLGDSVGGKLTTRHYSFEGGYAARAGDRFTYGAQVAYDASIDFRARDPRDKNVLSQLNLNIGGSYRLNGRYAIGLSAGFEVYNQESDIDFYNPVSDIRVYPLTGVGTWYKRFVANGGLKTAYTGTGFSTGLQFVPLSLADGLSASFSFANIRIKQILRDFNNLGLTMGDTYTFCWNAAYTLRADNCTLTPQLTADWERRIGTENLFGSSAGNTYLKISSRKFYYHDILDAAIAATVDWQVSPSASIAATPRLGGFYTRQSYRTPHRDIEIHSFSPSIRLAATLTPSRIWLVKMALDGEHRSAVIDRLELNAFNPELSLSQALLHNAAMESADADRLGAHIAVGRVFGRALGALKLDAGYTRFEGHGHAWQICGGIEITI